MLKWAISNRQECPAVAQPGVLCSTRRHASVNRIPRSSRMGVGGAVQGNQLKYAQSLSRLLRPILF